jgi:hypothetical protein
MGLSCGPAAPAYMFCSTLLCFGVHPCAAHFIQEHFTLGTSAHAEDHPQETFSYYGPLNKVRILSRHTVLYSATVFTYESCYTI